MHFRVIDGKDNRELVKNTKKSFHPAVAHMIMIYPDKHLRGKDEYFNGTGFLCSYKDKHFLLTAKHNVIDSAGGGREFTGRAGLFSSMATSHFPSRVQKAREVRIYFGRNGIKTKPNDCITVSGSNFYPAYGSRDYAILDLSSESAKLPGVRLDTSSLEEGVESKKIQIVGYPGCRSYGTRTYGAEPYTQWLVCVAVIRENDTYLENGLVMGYADCKYYAGLVSNISLALCQTHCKQVPAGQYGLCFGYCFSGPLPLRSHKEQVTFSGHF